MNKPKNIINSEFVQLGIGDHALYMAAEKFLCVKIFPKLLKQEILNTVKYLNLNVIFLLLSQTVSGTVTIQMHCAWKQFKDKLNKAPFYMLLSDKKELEINTHPS